MYVKTERNIIFHFINFLDIFFFSLHFLHSATESSAHSSHCCCRRNLSPNIWSSWKIIRNTTAKRKNECNVAKIYYIARHPTYIAMHVTRSYRVYFYWTAGYFRIAVSFVLFCTRVLWYFAFRFLICIFFASANIFAQAKILKVQFKTSFRFSICWFFFLLFSWLSSCARRRRCRCKIVYVFSFASKSLVVQRMNSHQS